MSAASSRDWDAVTYNRISEPQLQWAREQFSRLELCGDEVVLDAGCGSGRVTAELIELVPRGHVYGVDVAPSMAAHTQAALVERATILCQDLVELELPESVDAVFSNASFHWVLDHDALFAAIHRTLKPGGQLVAQCGGRGNIDSFRQESGAVAAEPPFAEFFAGWTQPWNYATAEETQARLQRAGFTEVSCWLEPKPTRPPEPRTFAKSVCLVRHLDVLPAELRDEFLDRVMERVIARGGAPVVLDYVRLNIIARRES
ncbi:MAG: methyltransferase domain-containing protein [Actinomycetota bacterium]|nr:methyltransferase domain-containing protein [Actinomycetota bacterium]